MSTQRKSLLFVISILTASLLLQSTHYHQVDSAPIIPILTAIASSAAGIFSIQVDTLHIAKYLRESANCKKNRGAFVRDLLYTAFYRSGQTHNVIVFNLGEEHRQRLYGVLFYGSVNYADGTRFGVWVFESGVFENKGERGWHNWGMIGTFKKSSEGETIYFQRRHKPPPSSSTATTASSTVIITDAHSGNYSTTASSNGTIFNTTTSTTTSVSISTSSTTVKPVDILRGFGEDTDVSALMKDKDALKNFIDEKNKAEGDSGDGDGGRREKLTPIRIDVNIKPKAKESSSGEEKSSEHKKQTPPKAKRVNGLSKAGKSTKLDQ